MGKRSDQCTAMVQEEEKEETVQDQVWSKRKIEGRKILVRRGGGGGGSGGCG